MDTQNLTAHYEDLEEQQVAFNLVRAADDPTVLPTHMLVAAGSVATQDSVTPNVGFPLSSTALNSVATAVGNGLSKMAGPSSSNTVTSTTSKSTAGSTFGLAATAQWSQNWTITPESDPDIIRRLRALYAYATVTIPTDRTMDSKAAEADCEFFKAYSIQRDLAGDDIELSPECKGPKSLTPWIIYGVNPNFIEAPGCVFCIAKDLGLSNDLHNSGARKWQVMIAPGLARGFVKRGGGTSSDLYLGTANGVSYFAPKNDLHEFELAVLESIAVATPTSQSPGSKGAPSGSTTGSFHSPSGGNPIGKTTGPGVLPLIVNTPALN